MRKHFIRSMFALALMFSLSLGLSTTSAQGPLANGWFTSVTVQNVGGATAERVVFEAYSKDSTTDAAADATSGEETIDVGANLIFLPGLSGTGFVDMTLPTGFEGGMVVSADQPIVAISQIGNNPVGENGVDGGNAIAQYRGSSVAANSISFPTVKNGLGNKITVFSIQAVGGTVQYNATITDNEGNEYTTSGTIGANSTNILLPDNFGPSTMPGSDINACGYDPNNADWLNTSPCLGSLTVEVTGGSGQLVGAVVETRSDTSPQNLGQAATMFVPNDAGTKVFCPVVKNQFNMTTLRDSGVVVQNLGNEQVTVQMTTVLDPASQGEITGTNEVQYSLDIPAGAARTFFRDTTAIPQYSFGAATIEVVSGNGEIIAAVNESNTGAGLDQQKSVTYTCFNADNATDTAAFPLVKEIFGGVPAATSVNLQNVTPGDTGSTIDVTYTCAGESPVTVTTNSLAEGQGQTLFLTSVAPVNGSGAPSNGNCAVTASASGKQIIGYTQDTSDLGFLGTVDGVQMTDSTFDLRNYEGFNQ